MGAQTLETKAAPARSNTAGKAWIWITSGLFALAVAGIIGSGGYRRFQEYRLVRKARQLYEAKDFSGAILFDRRVLELAPHDIEANRLMAEMADAAGSRESLYWRRSVSELAPSSLADHLKWADTALRLNETSMAEQALANIDAAGEKTAEYNEMVGRVAEALGQTDKAESSFKAASLLQPQNHRYQLDVARLQLASATGAGREQARRQVEGLAGQQELLSAATRALIDDALINKDNDRALTLARTLETSPGASFDDHLLYLKLLHNFQRPEFATDLADLQRQYSGNADRLSALVEWMNQNRLGLLALDWWKNLAVEARNRLPLPAAIAESYMQIGDWTALQNLVSGANWGQWEFLRSAVRARISRHSGDEMSWQNQWHAAVRAASSSPEEMALLARTAIAWGWEDNSEDLLWSVARGSTDQEWALQSLYRRFFRIHSTRNLLEVVTLMYGLDPKSLWVRNNLAAYDMLLQSNVVQGVQLAQDVYQAEPRNIAYAATYAYGLHLLGRSGEGAQILKNFDEKEFRTPSTAIYYGAILVATGAPVAEASRYLDMAAVDDLFPEQQVILDQAREQLARR